MKDYEVMLNALSKERERLHEEIMQVDRIIKKVKKEEYLASNVITTLQIIPTDKTDQKAAFPQTANIKVQALKIFDLINHAAKLREINDEFTKQTGRVYNLREAVRSLYASKLLLTIKEKDAQRSILWVKREWVVNGMLLDEHKPEGFDLLYRPGCIEFV